MLPNRPMAPQRARSPLTPDNIKNSTEINPADETMKRLQIFEDLGSGVRQLDRVWTKVKQHNKLLRASSRHCCDWSLREE